MSAESTLDILKEAILLERRGQAFYANVAEQAVNAEVKSFFKTMAEEEIRHADMLEKQFTAYAQHQQFLSPPPSPDDKPSMDRLVLSAEVKQRIAAADFEAAAISAAMMMEEKAVALYSERADSAQDPSEKKLYRWLAGWEREHLAFLAKLDKEIKETIWHDNHFWPY